MNEENTQIDEQKNMLAPGISRYQHVVRLGNSEVATLLDGLVIIQEKIDGANLTVGPDAGGFMTICSRNRVIYDHGAVIDEFRGAVKYVTAHEGIRQLFEEHEDWTLRGEWLTKHSVKYSEDAYNKLYIFDVQRKDGRYVPVDEYEPELKRHGILMAEVLFKGVADLAKIAELAHTSSILGAELKEGVVVKRYEHVNRYGRTTWGKHVNAEFVANKGAKNRTPKIHDPQEIHFVHYAITPALISKTISAIESDGEDEQVTMSDMGEVIGRVWYEAFVDELWDFVSKNKVQTFDFHSARKLANDKVRLIVTAYCDGILDLAKAEDWESLLAPDIEEAEVEEEE